MNKQAYLRMMTYGMRKNASAKQRYMLYKIATMYKQLGWLDDVAAWWRKGGNIKSAWLRLLKWLQELFKSKDPSSGDIEKGTTDSTSELPTDSTSELPTDSTLELPTDSTLELPTDSTLELPGDGATEGSDQKNAEFSHNNQDSK